MADILIRGMEMPKTCSQCPMCYDYMMCKLNHFAFWNTNEPFDCCNERLAGCPLVELPEHGDLIDVSKISLKEYEQAANDALHNGKGSILYDIGVLAGARATAQLVRRAPVVIPSNKEDDE